MLLLLSLLGERSFDSSQEENRRKELEREEQVKEKAKREVSHGPISSYGRPF